MFDIHVLLSGRDRWLIFIFCEQQRLWPNGIDAQTCILKLVNLMAGSNFNSSETFVSVER